MAAVARRLDQWQGDGGRHGAWRARGARGRREAVEVGIKSLASRRRFTTVYVPEGAFEAEIEAWRIRPLTGEDETAEARWAPFASVRRRVAPEWGNYREALEKMRFWVCLANTLAITFLGTAGTILSCSLVAYGFARFRFPGTTSCSSSCCRP